MPKEINTIKKMNKKTLNKPETEETEETMLNDIKKIKENIDEMVLDDKVKKNKEKFDLSLKNPFNLDKIFEYIENNNDSPKLKILFETYKTLVQENKFDSKYFTNLFHIISYYKLVVSSLVYIYENHQQIQFEISSVFEIPKNLIRKNLDVFNKTKFELLKKTPYTSVPYKVLDEIYVEETRPSISANKYLIDKLSDDMIKEFISVIYLTWIICIIHIKIFTTIIEENNNEEDALKKLLFEKSLEKFTPINADTNPVLKSYLSVLKKKTVKKIKKIENKKEKILQQDITSIEKNNIHGDEDDEEDEEDFNKKDKISATSFNLNYVNDDSGSDTN